MPHRVIFIHQNAPGQFKHLIAYCAQNPDFEVVVIGEKRHFLRIGHEVHGPGVVGMHFTVQTCFV